jgi:hypothetical protein
LAILVFYFANFFNSILSQESVAQFGDYLGGVLNPILGFATISLLVWSIQIQLRELKLTRDEVIENTKANILQANELKEQNELLRFEHVNTERKQSVDLFLTLVREHKESLNHLMSQKITFWVTIGTDYDTTLFDIIYCPTSSKTTKFKKAKPDSVEFIKVLVNAEFGQYAYTLAASLERSLMAHGDLASKLISFLCLAEGCYVTSILSKGEFLELINILHTHGVSKYQNGQNNNFEELLNNYKDITK